MIEILTESLRTAVLVTGLVVIMMMLIEVFNVSSSGRMFSGLRNRRFGQVLLSALLGPDAWADSRQFLSILTAL